MRWARNVCRIVWVVKCRRLHCKSGTGNKKSVPYAYDGEMRLQLIIDGGDTNNKQHLYESGVYETKI
jgi:hypothetical protein